MKRKLLIPITLQFGIRYFLRSGLLAELAEIVTPIILLGWQDHELKRELEDAGAIVHSMPGFQWREEYKLVRSRIDSFHLKNLASPSTAIDARRRAKRVRLHVKILRLLRKIFKPDNKWADLNELTLYTLEKKLIKTETNLVEFETLVSEISPDFVFSLTPFHKDEELLLRAAELQGIPMCAAIHSFDNVTTRGWISPKFQKYLVWNQYNASELVRAYSDVNFDDISIVGTPQFDFYWDKSYLWSEDQWRQVLKLPPGQPVILFAGGPASIVPHEPHFLAQLDDAIANQEIPGDPIILFRRHPLDKLDRWREVLTGSKHVIVDNPWQEGKSAMHFNVRRADLERLASTLHHCAVHISTSSTMTIDGAIFDRPQVGPSYDDRLFGKYDRTTKELYLREHYLPITHSGGMIVAESRLAYITAVSNGLTTPSDLKAGRKKLVEEICTFTDGNSRQRVLQEIKQFLDYWADPKEKADKTTSYE